MPKYKKNVPTNTISRDMVSLSKDTENIYETVMIIAKRANQIAEAKLQEFAVYTDDQQEMVENEEQIEISRQYERMPKATLIAAKEYEDGELYHNIAGRSKK